MSNCGRRLKRLWSDEAGRMQKILQIMFRTGCLTSVLALLVAIVVYPRGKWLFALPLAGVALLVFAILTDKGPTPSEVAERAQMLLDGNTWGWDVDDYEHMNPKDQRLKDLWIRSMSVGGLPQDWPRMESDKKNALREIIAEMRRIQPGT